MRAWLVSFHQGRNPRAQIVAVWLQTDLQPVKQNLCLAPDQKMVGPKKVANDPKINLAPKKMLFLLQTVLHEARVSGTVLWSPTNANSPTYTYISQKTC